MRSRDDVDTQARCARGAGTQVEVRRLDEGEGDDWTRRRQESSDTQ